MSTPLQIKNSVIDEIVKTKLRKYIFATLAESGRKYYPSSLFRQLSKYESLDYTFSSFIRTLHWLRTKGLVDTDPEFKEDQKEKIKYRAYSINKLGKKYYETMVEQKFLLDYFQASIRKPNVESESQESMQATDVDLLTGADLDDILDQKLDLINIIESIKEKNQLSDDAVKELKRDFMKIPPKVFPLFYKIMATMFPYAKLTTLDKEVEPQTTNPSSRDASNG